ncbi:MAG: hypothetical protein IPN17_06570 [Deltaproteobacteria bacterium]|nr:hypothetical protein [Deltaproteobacteria bacterium]
MRAAPLALAALLHATLAAAQEAPRGAQEGLRSSALDLETRGFNLSGALQFGVAPVNLSYGAYPDNAGLALFRYAVHADMDLIGQRLTVPLDVTLFTDGTASGLSTLSPTEFDVVTGLRSTWVVGPGLLELGTHFEHDRPVGVSGFTQTYVDVRARYLYSLGTTFPGLSRALRDGDISGWVALGWFAWNPTYAARPDNAGIALFRYVAHAELSLWHDHISFGLEGTMFSDRHADNPCGALGARPHGGGHRAPSALRASPRRRARRPRRRSGPDQIYAYGLAVWAFDLVRRQPRPLETRGELRSP